MHIPLSRLNVGFSVITAFLPLMLNLRTKYWFYEKANQLVCWVWKDDPEAVNIVKKARGLQVQEEVSLSDLTEEEPEVIDIRLSTDEKES